MGFEMLLGNDRLKENLTAAIAKDRMSHFYLISGPEGSGKHTLARLLAAAALCRDGRKPCLQCSSCRKVLEEAHDAAVLAFDAAAIDQSGDNRNALLARRNELKKAIENVDDLTDYEETIHYKVNDPWYEDPMINEYQYNWN